MEVGRGRDGAREQGARKIVALMLWLPELCCCALGLPSEAPGRPHVSMSPHSPDGPAELGAGSSERSEVEHQPLPTSGMASEDIFDLGYVLLQGCSQRRPQAPAGPSREPRFLPAWCGTTPQLYKPPPSP